MGNVVRKQLRNLPRLHNFEGLDNRLTEQREEWEEDRNAFIFCVSPVTLSVGMGSSNNESLVLLLLISSQMLGLRRDACLSPP